MARLGVNIDHVATLRQQREEGYPSLVEAAEVCLQNGADQITIHLREDRRHIQDTDVNAIKLVTQKHGKLLNLEMGCAEDIIEIAIATKPEWICLVPEKREEKTTEGGLNLTDKTQFDKIAQTCNVLKDKIPQTKISLFVEANSSILEKCVELKVDAVEIHTGEYARAILEGNETSSYIQEFKVASDFIKKNGLGFHAGHGLTSDSLAPLLEIGDFEEYNIGHWIICQAIFDGLGVVTSKLKTQLK